MLDLNSIYGEPNSIVTPFLRSFMGTFQVGIRNRGAKSSALHNLMVVALDREQAAEVAQNHLTSKVDPKSFTKFTELPDIFYKELDSDDRTLLTKIDNPELSTILQRTNRYGI